jgi:hypothetical protein
MGEEKLALRITAPKEGAKVQEKPFVEGTVSDPNTRVWVVVHPMAISTYWVQPAVTVKENGTWKVKVNIGHGNEGKGEQFEVMAVANPKVNLKEGDQLATWPNAEAKSQVVEVTRE